MIEITIFASSSIQGRELEKALLSSDKDSIKQHIVSLLEKEYNAVFEVYIRSIHSEAPEYEFHRAVLYSDIVIFDGSIEDEGIELGENYACIPHAPYLMDNVIVVSRTELPINFIPNAFQTNVTPIGEESDEERKTNSHKHYSNEVIIEWLKGCLTKMFAEKRIPRNSDYKIAKELLVDAQTILAYANKIYSLTEKYKKNRYEHTAFISYRSYYGTHESNGYSVQKLKDYILDYHRKNNHDEEWKVLYYTSDSLAQDCLTEYRRWGLMEYVNYIFKHVDEVWIFNTHDTTYGPSYWDSWFTQGEFISLMNLKQYLPHCCPIIMMFDSSTGQVEELKKLPKIQGIFKNELSTILANSDIVYGDIAAYKDTCLLKHLWKDIPIWKRIQLIIYAQFKFRTNLKKLLSSHSYDLDFFSNRIFSCPTCLKKEFNIDSFKSDAFIKNFINIFSHDAEMQAYNNKRGYFALTEEEFVKVLLSNRIVKCPNCGKEFEISLSDQCFYIWERNLPPFTGQHRYIDKVQAYNINEY